MRNRKPGGGKGRFCCRLTRLRARRARGWNQVRRPEFQHGLPPSGSHHAARLLEGIFTPVARDLPDRAFPRDLTGREDPFSTR
jgi:hypothetical protein